MDFQPIPGVRVLGLGYKARHGKDTVAQAIISGVSGAVRFSFADDLYAYCRVVHGMTTKDAPLLQRVGVEMREKEPNVWIRAVYAKMLDVKPRLAVITDVRFPNEQAFVKALGGKTVKVSRRNEDGSLFVDPSRPADHISETALDDAPWDIHIVARSGDTRSLNEQAWNAAKAVLFS